MIAATKKHMKQLRWSHQHTHTNTNTGSRVRCVVGWGGGAVPELGN